MNVAAFAVVVARERVSERGDDLASFENLGQSNPWLAWPMTIAMLSLAGFPATGGFIGKFFLIDASVDGDYTWLGIAIVVGSILSLAYYLRVIAAMWMGRYEIEMPSVPPRRVKPVSGWSPEADTRAQPEVAAVAIVCAVATILFGLWPDPLFDAGPRRGHGAVAAALARLASRLGLGKGDRGRRPRAMARRPGLLPMRMQAGRRRSGRVDSLPSPTRPTETDPSRTANPDYAPQQQPRERE